jgi:hypothetical protein
MEFGRTRADSCREVSGQPTLCDVSLKLRSFRRQFGQTEQAVEPSETNQQSQSNLVIWGNRIKTLVS